MIDYLALQGDFNSPRCWRPVETTVSGARVSVYVPPPSELPWADAVVAIVREPSRIVLIYDEDTADAWVDRT